MTSVLCFFRQDCLQCPSIANLYGASRLVRNNSSVLRNYRQVHLCLFPTVSILCGAIFVLVCDTLARTVLRPSELPVGSLTSMVGAPLFIYLLYKNKKGY